MIRHVPIRRARLGDTLPCCDPSMSIIDQLLSNTCQYCFGGQQQQQQTLQQQQGTTGVPCCDPSNGVIANLFSNTCTVCDLTSETLGSGGLGIATAIPGWAWAAGAGVLGLLIFTTLEKR